MYRDGNDGMGWHCDNNQNESLIICVVLKSLESRPIHIRPDGPPEEGDEVLDINKTLVACVITLVSYC